MPANLEKIRHVHSPSRQDNPESVEMHGKLQQVIRTPQRGYLSSFPIQKKIIFHIAGQLNEFKQTSHILGQSKFAKKEKI